MPTVKAILDALNEPLFLPLAVVVLAVMFLLVGRARKQARERLRRANEIEGRLRD